MSQENRNNHECNERCEEDGKKRAAIATFSLSIVLMMVVIALQIAVVFRWYHEGIDAAFELFLNTLWIPSVGTVIVSKMKERFTGEKEPTLIFLLTAVTAASVVNNIL